LTVISRQFGKYFSSNYYLHPHSLQVWMARIQSVIRRDWRRFYLHTGPNASLFQHRIRIIYGLSAVDMSSLPIQQHWPNHFSSWNHMWNATVCWSYPSTHPYL
jgi:hypothetical protein